ncbi:Proteasome subunit alpha type-2 [Coelomomyces lativittatus]|nr:Proteasome subunit alpha type-2 [Coelomomyces lativittatus]KAJ1500155.1 Proteasome subunit alpha type-2 [Coelomomyces lativittatus]KAJ1506203.1 Proteasome subunit alpha type-2 [Coelomomyces lativittatus]
MNHRYDDTLELDDAIHTAILTLKEGMEGQMTAESFEIGIITFDHKIGTGVEGSHHQAGGMRFRKLKLDQIKDYLENLM